jgi:hypothetical protein
MIRLSISHILTFVHLLQFPPPRILSLSHSLPTQRHMSRSILCSTNNVTSNDKIYSTMLSLTSIPPFVLFLMQASPTKGATNQMIISGRTGQCISSPDGSRGVSKEHVGNESPLIAMDCDEAAGWDISPGIGSISLTGTLYAMDAGTSPGNHGQLKVRPSSRPMMAMLINSFGRHTPVLQLRPGTSPMTAELLSQIVISALIWVRMVCHLTLPLPLLSTGG